MNDTVLILDVQYHPHTGKVALMVQYPSPKGPVLDYLNTDEDALNARLSGGGNWGNDEVLAEAQAMVNAGSPGWNLTVAFPDPPAPPAPPSIEVPVVDEQ